MENSKQNSTANIFLEEKTKKYFNKDFDCGKILYEAMECYIIFDTSSAYFCEDSFRKYMSFCFK
jgi:hypothetical protein